MTDSTFIVHSDWLNAIKDLPNDQQDKIIADLVRYGCRVDTVYDDIPQIMSYVNLLKGRIDYSIDKYNGKVGNKGNKGVKVSDEEIWQYYQENKCKSLDIANYFGISKSKVDHSEGWRQRNNADFYKRD